MEGKEGRKNLREEWPFSFFTDVAYSYVVDQQPIGQLLFRAFCESTNPHYNICNCFLDAVDKYEIELDERRVELGESIFNTFLAENVRALGNF